MRRLHFIPAICLTVSLLACRREPVRAPLLSDSRYTAEAAMALYGEDPARALVLLDSGILVGNVRPPVADFLRARIYAYRGDAGELDKAEALCGALLEDGAAKNDTFRFNVLEQLVCIARRKGDDEMLLRRAMQLAGLAHELGYETEALRTEAEIGRVETVLGKFDEGIARIDGVLGQLDGIRKFNELDATVIALKRKVNALSGADRPAKAIPAARRIMERLDDYERHPEEYADGSYREPDEAHRQEYIDFYRSQALAFLTEAYSLVGDTAQARKCLALFDRTAYAGTAHGRVQISLALCELGEYDRMLAVCDEMEQNGEGDRDTLNPEYIALLQGRALAAAAKGLHAESQSCWKRYARLSRRMNYHLHESRAHEYSARYHAQEQQLEIQRVTAASKRRGLIAAASLLLVLLSAVASFIVVRQARSIAEKNRVLAARISEAIEYRNKYLEEVETRTELPETADTSPSLGDMSDEQVFRHITGVIRRQKLFLDPNFGRQTVMDTFGLTKDRAGHIFSRGSDDCERISDFINDCRLEYSCSLLLGEPNRPLAEIACASGFSRYGTFGRLFKKKYALTPTQYRSQGLR